VGLAEVQLRQSDFAGALPDLEALAKSDPKNAAALRLLVRAYRGLGREQDARQAETRAAAAEKGSFP
jgi:Flp pilus assembly protein TadD